MNAFALLVINLTCLGCLTLAEADTDGGKTLPMEEWLDPGDMLHYDADRVFESAAFSKTGPNGVNKPTDCGRLQVKLSQCYKDLEKLPLQCQACSEKTVVNASPCDTPYFKKVVRSILGNLEDRGDHEVLVTASKDDVGTLEKFVKSGDGNVQDVCEVIIGIVSNFKGKDDLFDFGHWETSSLSYVTKEALLILAAIILVICAAVLFEMRTNLTWRSQLWFVLFLCFIISIPWEWYHLYRKAFASKQAQMEKEIPKQCRPDHELSPLESLKLWLRNSFTFSDDMCIRYQENLLVDPIWEVSPSKAISATVASIIAQPFEHIAEAIGKSFRALFREVPIQWQPFVFIAVIIIIIIAMFTLSGLQVRLPFMTITTVPALPGNFHADLQQLKNQVENVGAAMQQLNDAAGERDAIDGAPLLEDINNRQIQIIEFLNAMNERQQRRAEPAIQGAGCQNGALGAVERGANDTGAEDERPRRQPVSGTPRLNIPVQRALGPVEVPVQRTVGPIEVGSNDAGAAEERPEREPVMETPKLKFPVQNSEENTKFGVEDVGPSEES